MINLDLANIRKELQTQNNCGTADPIFCVFEKETIYGVELGDSDEYKWMNWDEVELHLSTADALEHAGVETEDELEEAGWEKHYYIKRDKFVNAHLTRKSAEFHIEINGHNLHGPFVYVTSMWRCPEMIELRKALLEGSLYIHDREPWEPNTERPITCSCGGMPHVSPTGEHLEKYQVHCPVCGTHGPRSSKFAGAINEWNMQVEALTTHRTIYEIIRNRVKIAKAKREAENV